MSSGPVAAKRPYDARRRRERAAEERRATRARVLEAATRLFVAQGYTATTMAEIAREAGVAMQSVYTAGRSKADLLHAAVGLAVAGDDQQVLVHERAGFADLADEPDPVRQVEMIADMICDIQERSAPIQMAYREAAAVDASVAAGVEEAHRRRRETFGVVVNMLPADRLRHSPEESTDTMWALGSTEALLLLRNVLGWTWPQIRTWLARTLEELLLQPEA
ncbi:MAG TPA: helix-turn-helix domain-containing protein [Acidimicrobiales bacterium]|jgi:AcrR family transcriptional regulator